MHNATEDTLGTGSEAARETEDAFFVLNGRSLRQLWSLMNTPRPVDYRGVRLVLGIVLSCYFIAACIRSAGVIDPVQIGLRGGICLYLAFGIWLATAEMTWHTLRLYSAALGVLLPLLTGYLSALDSGPGAAVTLPCLVTFCSLVFMMTAKDLLVVTPILAIAATLRLTVFPPEGVVVSEAAILYGGSIAGGFALSLVLGMYRAGLNERVTWWRASCSRERAQRGFAEHATAGGSNVDDLLLRFLKIFRGGDGRVAGTLALCGDDDLEVVSALSFPSCTLVGGAEAESCVRTFMRQSVQQMSPLIWDCEGTEVSSRVTEGPVNGRWVAIPLVVEGVAHGVVVLESCEPRWILEEDILLWQAVATQLGLAVSRADMVTQLRTALNAKTEFVNTMSHELRSPLNVIIGYAEMIEAGAVATDRGAERVRGSALELLQLVENTMAVAQMGTGKLGLNLEDFSLSDLAVELADHVTALPESQGKPPVRWNVEGTPVVVRLDRLKVKEIIQNLVSNGLKYAGGSRVEVCLKRHAESVEIEVVDCGVGIPPDAQSRIFDMFERVDRDSTTATPGVGLGLYIVKNLVDLLRGKIELVSSAEEGTRFTVVLPAELEPAADVGRAA